MALTVRLRSMAEELDARLLFAYNTYSKRSSLTQPDAGSTSLEHRVVGLWEYEQFAQ